MRHHHLMKKLLILAISFFESTEMIALTRDLTQTQRISN